MNYESRHIFLAGTSRIMMNCIIGVICEEELLDFLSLFIVRESSSCLEFHVLFKSIIIVAFYRLG